MDVRRDSFVIAINGASGSGKSTLTKALVQELGSAVPMFFDDYSPRIVPSSKYPDDITQWINDGADPDEWETPQLVEDLQVLRHSKSAGAQKLRSGCRWNEINRCVSNRDCKTSTDCSCFSYYKIRGETWQR
jgi:uridine kinase